VKKRDGKNVNSFQLPRVISLQIKYSKKETKGMEWGEGGVEVRKLRGINTIYFGI
jgi:hypothetical protein